MTVTMFVTLIVVMLALGLFVFRAIPGIRAYFDYRGKRLITCPETHKAAAVDVAAGEAAVGAFLSEPTLRLMECSRWPERQNCGQECLKQIEIGPENCLVWNIVGQWYEGKNCAFCHKPIGSLHHLDHAPALLGPDSRTFEWREFRPEQLPDVFATHRPVCWNCHVTETFRRLHPELVTDRRFEPKRMM
ncbi:MAG: hypothetical protein ABSF93_02070 [Candidatus Sulfotelmatobacter sp.]|jgi:hypothetical protein